MLARSLKSKITSPNFRTVKRQKRDSLTSQHRTSISFFNPVELRHTTEWTRDHLEWFNVDFDPHRFHTVPATPPAVFPSNPPSMDMELLAKVFSLVNEFRE
jgi:hypothetical protein